MNDDRIEWYIDTSGPDEEAMSTAFAWLYQLGEVDAEKHDAILAVNTKRQLQGVVTSVIGESASKQLDRKNPVRLGNVTIRLMTKKIDASRGKSGPVLAVYPDQKLLDKVDEMHGVTDVLVVPWNRDEVNRWIATWNATELGTNSRDGDPNHISEPLVEAAMETLHNLVNVSTGITHSSDRSTAIEIFKILQRESIPFNPDEIRAWLVAEKGWKPNDADDVRAIAEGVLQGKQYRYRSGLADDIFQQWQERAKNF